MNQQQQTPTCVCGHPELTHEHYRAGTDCGACDCTRFQAPRGNPMPDHAAPDKTIEVKVFAASAVSLAASLVVAWLNGLQENPDLLGGLDPTWQFIILTAVPPLLTFAGGWAKTSNRA